MASSLVQQSKSSASKAASKIIRDVQREREKTFSRPSSGPRKKDDSVEELVRMAASGIGLVSEAIHYRKEKKKRFQNEEQIPQHRKPDESTIAERVNEAIWELDEAEQRSMAQKTNSESPQKSSDVAKEFVKKYPFQPDSNSDTKLMLPVVLAQRRPKTRARGFVRAYAPVLDDVGINQETFLDFIDTLNRVLGPNPFLHAINLAGLAGMAIPDPLSMLVGVGAEIVTDAAMEAQSRSQSNKFLDCMNAEFFAPRGLVCLVITWRPNACNNGIVTTVDFEGGATECHSKTDTTEEKKKKKRSTDKKESSSDKILEKARERIQERLRPSNGAFEWSEVAPLTFPSLDKSSTTQSENSDAKKKKAIDRAERWLDEYMDSSAQAKWIKKNPDHAIANSLPKPEFRSRYADPNHPASSGDILAFLTGGRLQYGHANSVSKESSDERADSESNENQTEQRPKDSKDKTRSRKGRDNGSSTSAVMNLLQKVG
jgi:hypothetical protein